MKLREMIQASEVEQEHGCSVGMEYEPAFRRMVVAGERVVEAAIALREPGAGPIEEILRRGLALDEALSAYDAVKREIEA